MKYLSVPLLIITFFSLLILFAYMLAVDSSEYQYNKIERAKKHPYDADNRFIEDFSKYDLNGSSVWVLKEEYH